MAWNKTEIFSLHLRKLLPKAHQVSTDKASSLLHFIFIEVTLLLHKHLPHSMIWMLCVILSVYFVYPHSRSQAEKYIIHDEWKSFGQTSKLMSVPGSPLTWGIYIWHCLQSIRYNYKSFQLRFLWMPVLIFILYSCSFSRWSLSLTCFQNVMWKLK